jgi:threonine aldolase
MRQAMLEAEVGDDVFGDDPTVKRLEQQAAERMGKEAAVFVASGTMGNLAAVLSHCQRGDEVILGDLSHTYINEAGGISALGGVHPRPIPNQTDGTISLSDIEQAIRADDEHYPISRLISLEDTHNGCGGAALPPGYLEQVAQLAKARGLGIHLDGARIFNAAAVRAVHASELAAQADSVTFCLSKGLCAPVGSVLCGSGDFIASARRARKMLGGGMRQAGVLAAAGIVALDEMVDRLGEDHRRAARLAAALKTIDGLTVDNDPPQSNMVYVSFEGTTTKIVIDQLAESGIKLTARHLHRMRLVTHYWITDDHVDQLGEGIREAMNAARK